MLDFPLWVSREATTETRLPLLSLPTLVCHFSWVGLQSSTLRILLLKARFLKALERRFLRSEMSQLQSLPLLSNLLITKADMSQVIISCKSSLGSLESPTLPSSSMNRPPDVALQELDFGNTKDRPTTLSSVSECRSMVISQLSATVPETLALKELSSVSDSSK